MNIKGIVRGVMFSYIICAIVLLAASVAVYFSLIQERAASVAVFIGAIIGVFFGALGAARTAEHKKLPNALIVSGVFALTIAAAAMAAGGAIALPKQAAALIGSVIAAGAAAALFS